MSVDRKTQGSTGSPDDRPLLGLLRNVSRSFFLSVKFLPGRIRPAIAIGYLLARASDTIADTNGLLAGERLETLRLLRQAVTRPQKDLERRILHCAEAQKPGPERLLLEKTSRILALLSDFGDLERALLVEMLEKIIRGQSLDLERFELNDGVRSLQTEEELDEYTYLVAGAVGEFWTKLCLGRWPRYSSLIEADLLELGKSMGKGLQLINILRDFSADLKAGRCYLPVPDPTALVENLAPAAPLFEKWHAIADADMEAGWRYVSNIRPLRVRFACALPVLIGIRTLHRIGRLSPTSVPVKIKRNEVYGLMALSAVVAIFPGAQSWVFRRVAKASRY